MRKKAILLIILLFLFIGRVFAEPNNGASVNLLKVGNHYTGTVYLYDDGNLYYAGEYSNKYLTLVESNVKDVYYSYSNNCYYITNDDELYSLDVYGKFHSYSNYKTKILDDVKSIHTIYDYSDNLRFYIITNDNKLYSYECIDDECTFKYLLDDVKSIDHGMILTNNNDLYVYGENIYGEKFNSGRTITTPMLLYSNVKDYSYGEKYILLNTSEFIIFSSNTISPKVIETNVDKFYDGYDYSYFVSKNNLVEKININIDNKTFVVRNIEELDTIASSFIYSYGNYYYLTSNKLYRYYEKCDNSCRYVTVMLHDNVKQIFEMSINYNRAIYFITNDNKLYKYYKDEVYLLANNVLKYDDKNRVFVTSDNDYWTLGDNYYGQLGVNLNDSYINYPAKIVKTSDENVEAKSIYLYEGTKKDITVGDIEDILAIVLPYNATNQNISWSVSDDTVARISNTGELTALKEGVVTVYARTEDGNHVVEIEINVHPKPSSIQIYASNDSRVIGNNYNWFATTVYANVENENVIKRKINWKSSNPSIIRIEQNDYCTHSVDDGSSLTSTKYDGCAYLYASDSTGSVTITATSEDGGVSETIEYTVVQNSSVVKLSTNKITIDDKSTFDIKTILELNGFNINYLFFKTNSSNISIDENGIITAIKPGNGYVYVRSKLANDYNNEIAYLQVTVPGEQGTNSGNSIIKSISEDNGALVISIERQIGAINYEIYRSTSKTGTYKKIATITDTEYRDAVTYGTTYYYKVKACSSTNCSGYSNIISGKILPNQVEGLNIVNVSTNQIQLNWNIEDGMSGYELSRSTKSNGKYTVLTTKNVSEFTNTKLSANTIYYYRVRAYKTVGRTKVYGAYSEVVEVKTAPVAPKLSANVTEYNEVTLKVFAVKGATTYEIYRSLSKNGEYEEIVELESTNDYKDTELVSGVTYYYKVRACNEECGNYSSIVSKTPIPKVPTILLSIDDAKRVDVTINGVAGADGYEVYRSTYKNKKFALVGETDTLEYNDEVGLNTKYYYKVRAYRVVEEKKVYVGYSGYKYISVGLGTPTLTVSKKSLDEASITITEVPGAVGYEIYRSTSKTKGFKVIDDINDLEDTDELALNTTYYYKVRAYIVANDKKYYSKYSSVKSIKLTLGTPTFNYERSGLNNVTINITEVAGSEGYEIYRSLYKTKKFTLIGDTEELEYEDEVNLNTTYYYKVRAYIVRNGKKYYSSYTAVKSLKYGLGIPTYSITAGEGQVEIVLDEVTYAEGYEIYRATSKFGKYTKLDETTELGYDALAEANKTYYYRIRAYATINEKRVYSGYSTIKSAKALALVIPE